MTIAHRGLKVKVKVVDRAYAVGPASIEGSCFLVVFLVLISAVTLFIGQQEIYAARKKPTPSHANFNFQICSSVNVNAV